MGRRILDKYCPHCGYLFHGQRTGKCPNCGESTVIQSGRTYKIHPGDIKLFDKLDKEGGIMKALAKGIDWPSKRTSRRKVKVIAAAEDGSNVTIEVQGIDVVFYDDNGQVKIMGSRKDVHYYDPVQHQTAGTIMNDAYAMAAETMKENRKRFRRRMMITPKHQKEDFKKEV
jgi:hypothetical protein